MTRESGLDVGHDLVAGELGQVPQPVGLLVKIRYLSVPAVSSDTDGPGSRFAVPQLLPRDVRRHSVVDRMGFEPTTSAVRVRRSSS